jgi:hypothetical protein
MVVILYSDYFCKPSVANLWNVYIIEPSNGTYLARADKVFACLKSYASSTIMEYFSSAAGLLQFS